MGGRFYRPDHRIDTFLKNASSNDMMVDGSGTPVVFKYTCPANKIATVSRLLFQMMSTGGSMTPLKFGNATALTAGQGCLLKFYDANDNVVHDLLDGEEILNNSHFAWIAGVDSHIETATGVAALPVRATLAKSGDSVALFPGEYIGFTIRANLPVAASFTEFSCMIQGQLFDWSSRASLKITGD